MWSDVHIARQFNYAIQPHLVHGLTAHIRHEMCMIPPKTYDLRNI